MRNGKRKEGGGYIVLAIGPLCGTVGDGYGVLVANIFLPARPKTKAKAKAKANG